ncbi:AAA family ATPase [Morganella morganii]|uniref:AAA family ATPase n=2 Tax=Morganella morganii TaxID=582 RepID=UPI001BD294EA|nr:AAA family ATPase [Morganella morganii]MBT0419759.1 AAA family ATPase [Morganella morganii subsp. morganii]MBT0514735.1 AAA family ATPase [Morganella morganii subsp. morganii]MCU6355920.1 AAA family ATPase [Morganella morganii]QWM02858.1 AAA family ATPase [Morganella morganii subsp. morganii]HBL6967231.1 AAA family ATPase [Morganella morganii]
MKLNTLTVKNFRCYREKSFQFHPNVNLIVGQNATGKTAVLDAVAVAIATWILGFKKKNDKKSLEPTDATLTYVEKSGEPQFVEAWPVVVAASGVVKGQSVEWERSKDSPKGNTRYGNASELISLAKECDSHLEDDISLPLISYYGTMRLWQDPNASRVQPSLTKSAKPSRLDGYKHCVDPRIGLKELIAWFARQEWRAFQAGTESIMLMVVRKAVISCIENAERLHYDPKRKELILKLREAEPQPFSMLSDGQRCVLALIADIAQKAVLLNPHLGESVLEKTEGVVLIDELDLHLHPKWQRHVIEDLRTTFPNIQFIFTSHSPFLIQSLRSSEELIMLDGLAPAQLANKTLEDIAGGIMQVNTPEVSHRYAEMKGVATEYLKMLDEAKAEPKEKLQQYVDRLADSLAPYADNPAFQAFLEMKRVAKLGE